MATGNSVDKTLSRLSTWLSGAAFTGLVALAHLPMREPPPAPQQSAEVKRTAPVTVPPVSAGQPPANVAPAPETPRPAMQPSSIDSGPPSAAGTVTQPAASSPAPTPTATAAAPAAPGANPSGVAATDTSVSPPVPETWSPEELNAGLRQCLEMLAPAAAEIELAEPMRRGACGTPTPLALRSVGAADKVEFAPPPTMNCRLAASLSAWVDQVLQPAAQQLLGSRIKRIVGASSYSCRNIYNNPKLTLSEHATGNAIDISAFVTADGRTITVAKGWGPTERDIVAARKKAEKRGADKPSGDGDGTAKQTPAGEKPENAAPAGGEAGKKGDAKKGALQKVDYRRAAGKDSDGAKQAEAQKPSAVGKAAIAADINLKPSTTKEATFLKRLHDGSCNLFATVLGPEANEAHRDHFHLDMKVRRSSRGICQ